MNSVGATAAHLKITGMHCGACAARLQKALAGIPGVVNVHVDLALAVAHFTIRDADSLRQAAAIIADNGFATPRQAISLPITGMHCGNCAGRVEAALLAVSGVLSASANPATDMVQIEIAGTVERRAFVAAIEDAGYQVGDASAQASDTAVASRADDSHRIDLLLLAFAALLTMPLVLPMLALPFGIDLHLKGIWQLALAAPVQALVGWRFYRGAWLALKHGAANMDVLVALGTSAAFFYSLYLVLSDAHHGFYFEASAVVLTLVLAGKLMEARAKQSASAAVRALMELRPREAVRLMADGTEEIIAVDRLGIGDRIIVRPGGRVPADGIIRAGDTTLDEALVTGESMPVFRKIGDVVIEGAINGTGRLDVEVSAVGAETTLARVIRLVEQAQAGKAPVQRLVDRIAAVFVPVVLAIAAITFAGWWIAGAGTGAAVSAAVAVLVIACPCALGLATPAALVAGTGAAAKAGILIKDIEALQHLAGIDTVVFDKTGTLTEGKPRVTRIEPINIDRAALMAAALPLLAASEHPLSRAIVAHAPGDLARGAVSNFDNLPGAGVRGFVGGQLVLAGRPDWLVVEGIEIAAGDAALAAMSDHAETPVAIAIGGELAGIICLADQLRPNAARAVSDLADAGLDVFLMSGDSDAVVRAIAGKAGIAQFFAAMTPAEKAQEIARLGREGHHPAMVGDGVNDAAALAAADVGIAMGSGTDVAMETAGITLMRPDPRLVPAARQIARRTSRTIRQNLFWAFIYNIIGIPLAAFGLLSPALAGAAMAFSSVSVVLNALRLTRWQARLKG